MVTESTSMEMTGRLQCNTFLLKARMRGYKPGHETPFEPDELYRQIEL